MQDGRLYLRKCKLCGANISIAHILFICPVINCYREKQWNEIEIPDNFKNSLESLNYDDRTLFILNAFKVKYVLEWKCIYDNIASSVI